MLLGEHFFNKKENEWSLGSFAQQTDLQLINQKLQT